MIRKTIATLAVLTATIALLAVSAMAQDPGPQAQPEGVSGPRPPREGRQEARTEQRRDAWQAFSKEFNEVVQPSEAQQKQLGDIFREHAQQARNFQREHAASIRRVQQQLRQARKNQDKDAIEAAQKELDQHKAAREQQFTKLNEQLAKVLNEEQMAKAKPLVESFRDGRNRRRGRENGFVEQLDLTKEQQAKIKTIRDDTEAQVRKTDDESLREALRAEAQEKIVGTVLTDEQREELRANRPGGMARDGRRGPGGDEGGPSAEGERPGGRRGGMDLNLTEEQQAQRDAIIAEARKQAEGVEDRGERMQIMRQAMRQVHDEVLTDEQKSQIQQQRRERSPLGQVGATEEQHVQAEAIMAEAHQQAQSAETREARREIWIAAVQKVNDEVLTEEQRTKMQELRTQRRQQRRDRRQDGDGAQGDRPRRRPQGGTMQDGNPPAGEGELPAIRPQGRRGRRPLQGDASQEQ